MKQSQIRWTVGICLGMSMGTAAYLLAYPKHFSPLAQQAVRMGVNPASYVDARTLQDKAAQTKSLSSQEIERLRELSQDPSELIRMRAMTALKQVTQPDQIPAATEIARKKLSDPQSVVRLYALSALYKLHPADLKEIAKSALTDPEPKVRQTAQKILDKLANQPTS